jgi:hypothetical protein
MPISAIPKPLTETLSSFYYPPVTNSAYSYTLVLISPFTRDLILTRHRILLFQRRESRLDFEKYLIAGSVFK